MEVQRRGGRRPGGPEVKEEAWDIIWQFFVIEYSLITGKFELLQELGIKGIPVQADLWNASHKTQI